MIVLPNIQPSIIKLYGSNQFGFRPHSSTPLAKVSLPNFSLERSDSGVVTTDFNPPSILHFTLSFSDHSRQFSFIKSILEDRSHPIVWESAVKWWILASSCVPRRYVLFPYLFAANLGSLETSILRAKKCLNLPMTSLLCRFNTLQGARRHSGPVKWQLWF